MVGALAAIVGATVADDLMETRRCDSLSSAYLTGLQRRDPLGMKVETER